MYFKHSYLFVLMFAASEILENWFLMQKCYIHVIMYTITRKTADMMGVLQTITDTTQRQQKVMTKNVSFWQESCFHVYYLEGE